MMLQTPERSPYDLNFQFLGFPVRVTWTFWLVAAALGYSHAQSIDYLYGEVYAEPNATPGKAALLAVWIGVMFVSILVHELGHTLAFRYFGIQSQIVLYHFGGLAIPDSFTSWRGARTRRVSAVEQLVISAAGPVAQLLLGLLVAVIALSMRCTPVRSCCRGFHRLETDCRSLRTRGVRIDRLLGLHQLCMGSPQSCSDPSVGWRPNRSELDLYLWSARRSLRGQRLEYRRRRAARTLVHPRW